MRENDHVERSNCDGLSAWTLVRGRSISAAGNEQNRQGGRKGKEKDKKKKKKR